MAVNGKNPFLDFDVTKVMSEFRVPSVDVDAVVASQRKNIEALTQANQLAFEGVQLVARQQVEIARQAMTEFSAMISDLAQPGSPEDRLAKQAEFSKQALAKGLHNARHLAEIVAKANSEAFDVINKRLTEGLDEVREYATKKRAAAR
jgi:phasin family protein